MRNFTQCRTTIYHNVHWHTQVWQQCKQLFSSLTSPWQLSFMCPWCPSKSETNMRQWQRNKANLSFNSLNVNIWSKVISLLKPWKQVMSPTWRGNLLSKLELFCFFHERFLYLWFLSLFFLLVWSWWLKSEKEEFTFLHAPLQSRWWSRLAQILRVQSLINNICFLFQL